MSTLTKVFVVLLVVLSLLLAAASVTFLNTLPRYQQDIATLQQAQQAASAERSRAVAAEVAGRDAAERRAMELQNLLADANASVAQLRAELAQARAENADLQGQLAQASTRQTSLAQAVSGSTSLVNTLRGEIANIRETFDRTLQQNLELSRRVAEVSNELEFTTRALRAAQEDLREQTALAQQLRDRLAFLGESVDDFGPGELMPPPIAGRVIQRQTIGGQPYAMISVGSEDDVAPGMRFNVLSSETNELLGFITIEQVDDQVSIGRLSGPAMNRVGPNDEVRTRI